MGALSFFGSLGAGDLQLQACSVMVLQTVFSCLHGAADRDRCHISGCSSSKRWKCWRKLRKRRMR